MREKKSTKLPSPQFRLQLDELFVIIFGFVVVKFHFEKLLTATQIHTDIRLFFLFVFRSSIRMFVT